MNSSVLNSSVLSQRPIAITMGDAAGIGPEIIAQALSQSPQVCGPAVVVGSAVVMQRALAIIGSSLQVEVVNTVHQHSAVSKYLQVYEPAGLSDLRLDQVQPGTISAQAARAAYLSIECAAQLAMRQQVAAVCTAPIHKEALSAAQINYPGHTEMLADMSGTTDYAMILANPQLRTILVTIHRSVRQAIDDITQAQVLRIIGLAHRTLQQWGIAQPRIAVAGLNPHAGEGGLFGREEIEVIAPAIEQAQTLGIEATGPWPPDTIFMQASQGEYDIVVSQLHDHGLIAVKLNGVQHGVNITAGLPFIRTSPDHGTAFDIAGRGIADATSMTAALQMARDLAQRATHQVSA